MLFVAVPRLRRFWRGSGQRLSSGVSWTIAAGFVFVLLSIAMSNFRYSSLIEPDNLWISPAQTFAALFFVAVVWVLAGLLRPDSDEVRRIGPWITLTLLVGAVAGAKATFVPMVICGLAQSTISHRTRVAGPTAPR